jgi:hypothetical protein
VVNIVGPEGNEERQLDVDSDKDVLYETKGYKHMDMDENNNEIKD